MVANGSSPAVHSTVSLMTAMIEAGAGGCASRTSCRLTRSAGAFWGKVLVPTGQHIQALTAARFAADVLDVPSLVIARTGARTASLLTTDTDERDHEFLTGEARRRSTGRAHLDDASAARFRKELAAMGYRFQVITPAGFSALDEPTPRPARQHAHTDLRA
jgi:isocitrate lyase